MRRFTRERKYIPVIKVTMEIILAAKNYAMILHLWKVDIALPKIPGFS